MRQKLFATKPGLICTTQIMPVFRSGFYSRVFVRQRVRTQKPQLCKPEDRGQGHLTEGRKKSDGWPEHVSSENTVTLICFMGNFGLSDIMHRNKLGIGVSVLTEDRQEWPPNSEQRR